MSQITDTAITTVLILKESSGPIAKPTIEETLSDFLKDPLFSTDAIRADERETALELFRSYLYYHGRNYLSPGELALHDSFMQKAPPDHKGFHQIFGPAKIPQMVPPFLNFLARELTPVAAQKFISRTCSIVEELCLWLIKEGLALPEEAEDAACRAAAAASWLPRAMRALKRLHKDAQLETREEVRWTSGGESECYRIARLHSNMLWLENEEGETVGPITISAKIKTELEVGWEMHCNLIKRGGRWMIIGLGGIFPVFTV